MPGVTTIAHGFSILGSHMKEGTCTVKAPVLCASGFPTVDAGDPGKILAHYHTLRVQGPK